MGQRSNRVKLIAHRMGRSAASVGLPRTPPAYMTAPLRIEDWLAGYDDQKRSRIVVKT